MNLRFEVLFLETAREFLRGLDFKTRSKILYNIDKSRFFDDPKLFKKLTNDIWEFRTVYNGLQYRLLAFWEHTEKALVISTHGFVKKTDKVPAKEIIRAGQMKSIYFEQKPRKK